MKKYFFYLFALLICVSLVACGGKNPTNIGNDDEDEDDEDVEETESWGRSHDRSEVEQETYEVPEIKEDKRSYSYDEPRELPRRNYYSETPEYVEQPRTVEQVVTQVSSETAQPEKVFDVVEQMPTFPGGASALMQYLASNIKYPAVAQENGIQGRVVVKFVVETDGSISNVVVVKAVDPSLDQEAVRVVKNMPRWNPGKINGQYVRVNYNVPVSFKLQ